MTTRYVGSGGNDGNSGLTWALRKLTLNGAENTPVAAGDIVYVAPGVYREVLTVDVSGGNLYQTGTVDVTSGSKQVTGSGTAWLANVAADYVLRVVTYASGTDGVANGTATFTSAAGNFQAAMIGKSIGIAAKGAYLISAVASVNSITLSDPSSLGWPSAGSGLTYFVMSGEGPYDVSSVDDNTTIQLKQPWNGPTLTAIAYLTYNPIRYIGDVTGEHTDGVGGTVRVTGSNDDQTAIRTYCISANDKDYRIFRGFMLDTANSDLLRAITGCVHWTIEDFSCENSITGNTIEVWGAGQAGWVLRRGIFLGTKGVHLKFYHSVAVIDANHLVENCIFLSARGDLVDISYVGDGVIKNCLFIGGGDDHIDVVYALTQGHHWYVSGCIFLHPDGYALEVITQGEMIENHNILNCMYPRSKVIAGANSITNQAILLQPPLLCEGFKFPWMLGALSEWSQVRATACGNKPSNDVFGIARPVTISKSSWGPVQFRDVERETTTTRGASAASICLHDACRHQIFMPVANESTTISVYVYRETNYAGDNPQLIVKQPGQADDVTTDANAASQWNLLTTTLTPSAGTDFVVVELVSRNTATAGDYDVFFDDLAVT